MSLESTKEEQQLKNRIKDLAEKSFRQNTYTFTGFLGLSEQDVFWKLEEGRELQFAGYRLWGGYEEAERKVVRFGSPEELGYEEEYPIVCIHIQPLLAKFADNLSHRDFLGAQMNLGIERSTLGDIRVVEKEAYLYCLNSIADYICESLDKVKHTNVKCTVVTETKEIPQEEPEEMVVQLPSLRLDACLAKVYKESRNTILDMFRTGKVYVNGKLCENNSKQLKEGDVVNLRGYGKFIFDGMQNETKKGKLNVRIRIYK